MERIVIDTDVLIIGGGTAGCFAARTLGAREDLRVTVVDKAAIERSGCLAAGVNAINAYITRGRTPEFYADYAMDDANGIARYDLLISMSERLNRCAEALEDEGLVFLKDAEGRYAERGTRNVKINGENIKPLLARAARRQPNVRVVERVNVTDLLVAGNRVYGACGFGVEDGAAYVLRARAVIVATGGAAGLYRPNNPGFSRHKMWYAPFNTGAGYAMGIRAGAEMTSFEMRFIALRCKDTIAPTGTIAQGAHAKQVNAAGEVYETAYGLRTSERVWGTVEENRAGRGPCYLRTRGIGAAAEEDLYRAYLNMAPAQTLKWVEAGAGPDARDVEIEGTEPYVVGGHTASGYWVDVHRATTVAGLFAAGDVAGGAPQKYVTGALAEGEIAAESAAAFLDAHPAGAVPAAVEDQAEAIVAGYAAHLGVTTSRAPVVTEQVEEAMQKVMDEYAGGISTGYRYNARQLERADEEIRSLAPLVDRLRARTPFELLAIYELRERLTVCRVLIAHMAARKETRWHAFAERTDYPEARPEFEAYVNSRLEDGDIRIVLRDLVGKGECLEHLDR
ncbi:MAG: adenylyl-sulfate reductase subunit alpha [Eggerthellaceae bacterium]|nr:adenylyl-sulfate reductase subunit alpha [Eggerthellaceae bacterium]